MVNDIFLSCNPINENKVSAGRFLKNQMKKGRLEAFSDGVLAIIINYYGFRNGNSFRS